MRFRVIAQTEITDLEGELLPAPTLDAILDGVMDHLTELGADDPDINAALALGRVDLSVDVESATAEAALVTGAAQIRTAVHVTGGRTPSWSLEDIRLIVEQQREDGDDGDAQRAGAQDLIDA